MFMDDPLNIVISGVGGQGNVIASHILALACVKEGLHVSVGETYGASQRGGSVESHVRLSKAKQYGSLIPKGLAHIILGFEPVECLRAVGSYGNRNTRVIINPRPIYPIDVLSGISTYPEVEDVLKALKDLTQSVYVIEATKIAQKIGKAVMQNVVMIGCLAGSEFTPVMSDTLIDMIKEVFGGKSKENLEAFSVGLREIKHIEPL
ncbi:MAG: indolepyruvate oxidoreductase subunit beta [Candidatus Bathyarchaeota archaeon]|jgi:indolepyruvate ferredoxin oxidoreductase beta subunit